MDVIWLGHACFRLRGRDATVLIDPYVGRVGGHLLGSQTADLACITNAHPHHAHTEALPGEAPIVRGPGEYEIKGVAISAFRTPSDDGNARDFPNTAYVVEVDGVVVCHLGDLARSPGAALREQLRSVDVLLVPVGGHCTIDAAGAAETISLVEPKYVVPMHYGSPDADPPLDPLDRFLKEMGLSESEPQSRLAVTKSSLPESTQVIVLEARR